MDAIIKTIDAYIDGCDEPVKPTLNKIRETIRKAAPDARETISYSMPAFEQNGVLVYFAACKKHIGFYPTPSALEAFREELSGYKGSKGAVQFPLNQPVPYDLIEKITRFRVQENERKAEIKKSMKQPK